MTSVLVAALRPAAAAWEDGRMASPSPLQLVLGDEELLVARGIAAAVAEARRSDADATLTEFTAKDMTPGDLAGAVSPSLFGGVRVVVVRDAQEARKDLVAALLAYFAEPELDVVLVVAHTGGARAKALIDGLKQAGATVIAANRITRHRERIDFIRDEIRRLGGRCADDAAETLIAAVGTDLRDLAAACSQLVADTDGRVEAATVNRYYRGRAEVTGFNVADAAITGDLPRALETLRWALNVGVEPVLIADALADGVRTVTRVASAGRGSAYQLAGSLGLPPWKVERAQRQARGWQAESLATAMLVAAECNAQVKGGAEDRGYALERAVFALTEARAGGASSRGGGVR
jgi:DNA polymerase-3 subunit delta